MKDKIIKVRISEEEDLLLEEYKKKTGKSKSEIIRTGLKYFIEKNNDKKEKKIMKYFIEKIERKDIGFSDIQLWDSSAIVGVLENNVDAKTEEERLALADEALYKLLSGEEVVLGKNFVSTFKLATEEEIALARKNEEKMKEELDAFEMPEIENFFNKLKNE